MRKAVNGKSKQEKINKIDPKESTGMDREGRRGVARGGYKLNRE